MNTLFDNIPKKVNTSKMAYNSVKPHISKMKRRVLTSLHKFGNACDDILEQRLGMSHQSLSACRRGCVKDGFVEATGDTGHTRSGRKANIWRITPEGIIALRIDDR